MKGDGIWGLVGLAALAFYLDYRRRRSGLGAPYDPSRPGEGTNVDPADPGYATEPVKTSTRPAYIPMRPAPVIPGGLPAAQIVEIPAMPSPQTQALAAKLAAEKDAQRKLYESARAMEAIKAAFAAEGKALPGAKAPAPYTEAARAYDEAMVRFQLERYPSVRPKPGLVESAQAWVIGKGAAYGGPEVRARTRNEVGRSVLSAILDPDAAARIMQADDPEATEMAAGGLRRSMSREGLDDETISRVESVLDLAGTVAEKAFEDAVAMGKITSADVENASLNPRGQGAMKIANYLENAVLPATAPKMAELVTEAEIKKEAGNQFTESEIAAVAKGVRDDTQKLIDGIAATDRNFTGRREYIESAGMESAKRHMRSFVEQKVDSEIQAQLKKGLGDKIPSDVLDDVSSAVAQDVGKAFYQTEGIPNFESLERTASESALRNMLPYIPSIGERYAGDALKSLGFVLSPEQQQQAAKLIGQDLATTFAQKLRTGDYDIENMNPMGAAIASAARHVGPMFVRGASDKVTSAVSDYWNAFKEKTKPMLEYGGGVLATGMVQRNKEEIVSDMERKMGWIDRWLGKGMAHQLAQAGHGDISSSMARQLREQGRIDRETLEGEVLWNTAKRVGEIAWENVKANTRDALEDGVRTIVAAKADEFRDPANNTAIPEEKKPGLVEKVTGLVMQLRLKEAGQVLAGEGTDILVQESLKKQGLPLTEENIKSIGAAGRQAVAKGVAQGKSPEELEEDAKAATEMATLNTMKQRALNNELTVSEIKKMNDKFFPDDLNVKPLVGDGMTLTGLRMTKQLKAKLDDETRKIQYEDEGWAPVWKDGKKKMVKLDLRHAQNLHNWRRQRAEQLVREYEEKMRPKWDEEARKVDEYIATRSPVVQEARDMITKGMLTKAPRMADQSFDDFVDKYGYKGTLTTDSYQRLLKDYASRMEQSLAGDQKGEGPGLGFFFKELIKPNIDILWPAFAQAADPTLDQRERFDRLKKFAGALDALTAEAANVTIPKYLAQQGDEAITRMLNQQVARGIDNHLFQKYAPMAQQLHQAGTAAAMGMAYGPPANQPPQITMQGLSSIDDVAAMEFG